MIDGWICLDKPKGISSNFAMVKTRRILERFFKRSLNASVRVKTGYIGTLDPFATGVLPIAVGGARKFIQFTNDGEKHYEFVVHYGVSTDTCDVTGNVTDRTGVIPLAEEIERVIPRFIGEIEQIPPQFSAVKIKGRRACDLARQNRFVEIPPRKVKIFDLKLTEFQTNGVEGSAKFFVRCSKGTYVRSLAVDMASAMKSLCYVSELRRTKSGFFSVEHSISLEKLSGMMDNGELDGSLIPLESPLDDIPALSLESDCVSKLRNGLAVRLADPSILSSNARVFEDGSFRGVCFVSADGVVSALKML